MSWFGERVFAAGVCRGRQLWYACRLRDERLAGSGLLLHSGWVWHCVFHCARHLSNVHVAGVLLWMFVGLLFCSGCLRKYGSMSWPIATRWYRRQNVWVGWGEALRKLPIPTKRYDIQKAWAPAQKYNYWAGSFPKKSITLYRYTGTVLLALFLSQHCLTMKKEPFICFKSNIF